jgi:hypothetical protein
LVIEFLAHVIEPLARASPLISLGAIAALP